MKKNIKFILIGIALLLLLGIWKGFSNKKTAGGEMAALHYATGQIISIDYDEERFIVFLDEASEYYDTTKVNLDYSAASDKDKMKKIPPDAKIKFGFFLNNKYEVYLIDAENIY